MFSHSWDVHLNVDKYFKGSIYSIRDVNKYFIQAEPQKKKTFIYTCEDLILFMNWSEKQVLINIYYTSSIM